MFIGKSNTIINILLFNQREITNEPTRSNQHVFQQSKCTHINDVDVWPTWNRYNARH